MFGFEVSSDTRGMTCQATTPFHDFFQSMNLKANLYALYSTVMVNKATLWVCLSEWHTTSFIQQ